MEFSFRIYGTVDTIPAPDEILELLEESEFDVTIELSDEDEEEEWAEVFVYEATMGEPISIFRLDDESVVEEEIQAMISQLTQNGNADETKDLRHVLDNCVAVFGVEVPEEAEDDDNAIVLASLIVQWLAQKTDGVYCVDGEGFFNDSGDLIYELALED